MLIKTVPTSELFQSIQENIRLSIMGYYTRVFCTSSEIPALSEISTHLEVVCKDSRIEFEEGNLDKDWKSFSLYYKNSKLPLLVELNKRSDEDNLANEEIDEFIESIGAPMFSLSKRKVINHLIETKYVVVSQLPTSDIDEEGYEVNGALLQIFASQFGGIVQADGEGFYLENKLVVKEKE
jgi:hypothetical protein